MEIRGLKLKLKVSKPKAKPRPKCLTSKISSPVEECYKRVSLLVVGTVVYKDNSYYAHISKDDLDGRLYPNSTIPIEIKDYEIPFTDDSYNLRYRNVIFERGKKLICYILSLFTASINSSYSEKYVPFSPNWYIIGNIISNGTKLKFEFKRLGNRIDVNERIKKDDINDYEE